MGSQGKPEDLSGVLKQLMNETDGERMSVGDCLDAFDSRTHGPFLLLPGLIVVLPTGALPGVPHVMGIFLTLVSLQILFMRGGIWLPERLRAFSFSRETLQVWVDRILPYVKKLEKVVHHRVQVLTGKPAQYAIALVCLGLGPVMFLLAMVPFGATLPGFAIFLFGLGLVSRDGVVVFLALAFSGGSAYLLYSVGNPFS
jgi:hypothetical protein